MVQETSHQYQAAVAESPLNNEGGDASIVHLKGVLPGMGVDINLGLDPDGFIEKYTKKYGDVFSAKFNGKHTYFLTNAHDIAELFKFSKILTGEPVNTHFAAKAFNFSAQDYQKADPFLIQKAVQKKMSGASLGVLSQKFQIFFEEELTRTVDEKWQEGNLAQFVSRQIFMTGTRSLFGEGIASPERYKAYLKVNKSLPFIAAGLPRFMLPGLNHAQKVMEADLCSGAVGESEAVQSIREVLEKSSLDMSSGAMADKIISGAFWASQANTIVVAFWVLYFILRDKKLRKLIQLEVDAAFSKSTEKTPLGSALINDDLLGEMHTLGHALSETLRLVSATLLTREATEDLSLNLESGALDVKKGERVLFHLRALHLDSDIYSNPNEFVYDRFANARTKKFMKDGRALKNPFLPFGGGTSICPGRFFALNEFKLMVALMLHYMDIELLDTKMPEMDFSGVGFGSLPPQSDLRFSFKYKK